MKRNEISSTLRRLARSRTTHVLYFSHMVVWVLLALLNPKSWAPYLAICVLSFLFTAVFVGHKQAELYSAMNTYDRIFTPAMQIANKTLPFLRTGLNQQTAAMVAEVIKEISGADAVAITDDKNVLAYLGIGYENHPPGEPIVTQATQEVIRDGKLRILRNKREFQCTRPNCTCALQSAVIAPLTYKGRVAGTVKLYLTQKGDVPDHFVKLAYGMAELLSMQMELAEIDYQTHLAVEAKLDALQAQINPHFLFNTLNTIGALIRINPSLARSLLYRFASYFRYSLKEKGRFVTVREELEFIRNYLILEKARFGRKLNIIQCVDPDLKEQVIPILSVQPLIENAIRHGITPKESPGTVKITVRSLGNEAVEISVKDDGVGIKPELMPHVLEPGFGTGSGVGMSNVHERLKMIYGEENGLIIASTPGEGTEVKFSIPRQIQNIGSEIHEA